MPFTVAEFFYVFAVYNEAIWPVQILAYILGAVAVFSAIARRSWSGPVVGAVLGVFWMWNGLAYHLVFFSTINTAAYAFAAIFTVQGLLFIAYGTIGNHFDFALRADWRGALGLALIIYAALLYRLLGISLGHTWPVAPMFGVAPCPTAIFTFGLLMLTVRPLPVWLIAIPVIWALIGTSAAIILGVPEDWGLAVAGLLGVILLPAWSPLRSAPAGRSNDAT